MRLLRDHLGRAKNAYQAVGYPGDLAADVLVRDGEGAGGWRRRWVLVPLATAGIAAAILFALWPAPIHDSTPVAPAMAPAGGEVAAAAGDSLPIPALPGGLDVTLHLPGLAMPPMPSAPPWPSFDFADSSTTKESV